MSSPSVCIPRIHSTITKYKLYNIFKKSSLGMPLKIIISNGSAFVYFQEWHSEFIRNKLLKGEEINIVYEFPFYIKCRANHNIYYLKNIHLTKELNTKTKKIDELKQNLMHAKSLARYLNTNVENNK